jgi:hypothetical protein
MSLSFVIRMITALAGDPEDRVAGPPVCRI